ncbi:MAG TPA: hypothetical protein VGM02_17605 [Acidobacteriaceae bacterium]|jgi:hypothetical protein
MDPNSFDPGGHLAYLMPFFGLFFFVGLAIIIIPLWQICKKAGFSPWLSLLIIVPFGVLILLYILAFAQWKVAPLPQYATGYPPGAYPAAYPPAAYPPAAPPASPSDPYPRS